ncbi:MAG: hypothetical protein IPL61_37345 [Myxococcales bacterium]|nr:hypothetical protein [Myxococcales bacterium]
MIAATAHLEAGARRRRGRPPAEAPVADDADARSGDLVCATCGRRITHDDHRVAIAGAHEHTFVNPGGFVHVLGCFALATGLSYVGDPETAWSWFPGYAWQISACMSCGAHLGWIYRGAEGQFHGLLRAQLARRG